MYRQEIYVRMFQAELKSIMQSRERGCLTLSPENNPYYYPANVLLGFANRLIPDLDKKQNKTVQEYIYLIVALKMTNEKYLPALSEFKEKHPTINGS
jgi:hypothetical protein